MASYRYQLTIKSPEWSLQLQATKPYLVEDQLQAWLPVFKKTQVASSVSSASKETALEETRLNSVAGVTSPAVVTPAVLPVFDAPAPVENLPSPPPFPEPFQGVSSSSSSELFLASASIVAIEEKSLAADVEDLVAEEPVEPPGHEPQMAFLESALEPDQQLKQEPEPQEEQPLEPLLAVPVLEPVSLNASELLETYNPVAEVLPKQPALSIHYAPSPSPLETSYEAPVILEKNAEEEEEESPKPSIQEPELIETYPVATSGLVAEPAEESVPPAAALPPQSSLDSKAANADAFFATLMEDLAERVDSDVVQASLVEEATEKEMFEVIASVKTEPETVPLTLKTMPVTFNETAPPSIEEPLEAELLAEPLIVNETVEVSPPAAPLVAVTYAGLLEQTQASTMEEALLVGAFFLGEHQKETMFTLSDLKQLASEMGLSAFTHAMLEQVLEREWLEMVPDTNGLMEATYYTLASLGKQYVHHLLSVAAE